MNFWFLLQLLVNVILFTGIVGVWIRMNRPAKEDPRLSKGLQLLQSKIAVLEDLSDRTETQVNQLTLLIEQKVKEIQSKIQSSEKQIAKIDLSMQKSLEVAKIFQDKIPHGEIVERQNTIKYVKAARLAHQGLSVDEIAQQVTELSRGEIEFIAKINREQLMFCEDSLPEWIENAEPSPDASNMDSMDFSDVDNISFMSPLPKDNKMTDPKVNFVEGFEVPNNESEEFKKLGEAFKSVNVEEPKDEFKEAPKKQEQELRKIIENDSTKVQVLGKRMDGVVRPVMFPRINSAKDVFGGQI